MTRAAILDQAGEKSRVATGAGIADMARAVDRGRRGLPGRQKETTDCLVRTNSGRYSGPAVPLGAYSCAVLIDLLPNEAAAACRVGSLPHPWRRIASSGSTEKKTDFFKYMGDSYLGTFMSAVQSHGTPVAMNPNRFGGVSEM